MLVREKKRAGGRRALHFRTQDNKEDATLMTIEITKPEVEALINQRLRPKLND
jgi:hypothetical protein